MRPWKRRRHVRRDLGQGRGKVAADSVGEGELVGPVAEDEAEVIVGGVAGGQLR